MKKNNTHNDLFSRDRQRQIILNPLRYLVQDVKQICHDGKYTLGQFPKNSHQKSDVLVKNTCAILGIQLGDEGKGRIVDNEITSLLKKPGVKKIYIIRFQGGNNAGHTVKQGNKSIALHQVPSMVFYRQAVGIMERRMVIHPEDLETEVKYSETISKLSLKNRLFLSREAILCTDLERAEEVLNRLKTTNSKGGTGRGIGPAVSGHYNRLGLKIKDLMDINWKKALSLQYDRKKKEFQVYGEKLSQMLVPDFKQTKLTNEASTRTVGSKQKFLERLEKTRNWLLKRKIVCDTFPLEKQIMRNIDHHGVIFEGAQGMGLHPWLGTLPDITSTDTSGFGIQTSSAVWLLDEIKEKIGVFKANYMSSVGSRHMPTQIDVPQDQKKLTKEQQWAAWIREVAHEYGTTTKRPRDICHLDLSMMIYACRMSGTNCLAATHLDITKENEKIKVCTHYTRKDKVVTYAPGLEYLENVTPHYLELDGWDGTKVQNAKTKKELPENAKRYLAFIEARVCVPVVIVTTGPKREQYIDFRK